MKKLLESYYKVKLLGKILCKISKVNNFTLIDSY